MNYIVFDMEWNQAGYGRPMIKEPLRLEGEIIQIGALKLSDTLEELGEFNIYIKPRVYRKMNRKVQQITHISNEDLAGASGFSAAVEQFRAFCGEDFRLVTWGSDDMRVLRQNLAFKHCDADWIPEKNYDLQLVYDRGLGNKNESALAAALEHFGIELDRPQHDALNDAYYTAAVFRRIGTAAVDELYSAAVLPKRSGELKREEFTVTASRRKTIAALSSVSCPLCPKTLECSPWVEQGGGRYITMCTCPEHGELFLRLRFKRQDEQTLLGIITVFELEDEHRALYDQRAAAEKEQPNHKRRTRRRKASAKPAGEGAQATQA